METFWMITAITLYTMAALASWHAIQGLGRDTALNRIILSAIWPAIVLCGALYMFKTRKLRRNP
jgi:ABC-type spermidine/putrescine transport system permease subunit II